MNYASTMDLILCSITTYVGCYYLSLYLLRSTDKTNLYFSLLCFSMALLDLMTVGLYTSSSLHSGIIWQKRQYFSTTLIALSFVCFTFSLLDLKSNAFKKIFILFFLLIMLCEIVLNEYIVDVNQPMIREVKLFNFSLVYYEARFHSFFNGLALIQWAGMFYAFILLLIAYGKQNKRYLGPFIISVFVFFVSSIIDSLIVNNTILFLYTAEYSFFLVILVMDFTLQKRFIRTFAEIEVLNVELENKVIERTSEIKKMADTLTATNKILEEKNHILAELAERDGMTKLLNHAAFHMRVSELLSLARRQHFSISIIIMDIDHFKNINDTYGHQVGDQIIVKVAEILLGGSKEYDIKARLGNDDNAIAIIRDYDTAGRYGGDEFSIALPFCMVPETKIVADRICEQIQKLSLADYPDIHVTTSMGCAVLLNPAACENELRLIRLADQALYTAKKQGRNQSVILTFE
jgi:GGDEF domain-containing protein